MPDFAFRNHGDSRDETVLASRGHAERLRRHLRDLGHEARVERGHGPTSEHRVYLEHPEHSDTIAYVSQGDVHHMKHDKAEGEATWEPHWTRK